AGGDGRDGLEHHGVDVAVVDGDVDDADVVEVARGEVVGLAGQEQVQGRVEVGDRERVAVEVGQRVAGLVDVPLAERRVGLEDDALTGGEADRDEGRDPD